MVYHCQSFASVDKLKRAVVKAWEQIQVLPLEHTEQWFPWST